MSDAALARTAIGAIALHVLDDNFIQPEAGTSAGDHLISGLVPLAALLVFATAYPRLRAGLRAALAIATGLLGIVAGVGEAGYYSLQVGPSGDDYTGLVMLAAGLLLVGLGVTTLWTSRRRDDRLPRRYLRRLAQAAVAVVVAYVVLFPFALSYVFTHSAAGRGATPTARRCLRQRQLHDQRRADAQRLVRSFQESRRSHRGTRPSRLAETRAPAHPPRLRGPALRPPR